MNNTSTTIHKENSLIQNKRTSHLSTHSMKTLDYLYLQLQKHLNHTKKSNKANEIKNYYDKNPFILSIKQTTIRDWLGLGKNKNYIKVIREMFKELTEVIELKNYINEKGEPIVWGLKTFIKNVEESVSKEDNKTKIYHLEIDKFLFNLVLSLKKDFTKIELEYQKNWKSVNTIRLYQYIKSIQSMKHNTSHNTKWFNDYFAPKTKLTYLSECERVIKRNIILINRDTDLRVILIVNKKEKTFIFNIENKKITIKNIGKIAKKF